jgi:hypothetical protein
VFQEPPDLAAQQEPQDLVDQQEPRDRLAHQDLMVIGTRQPVLII